MPKKSAPLLLVPAGPRAHVSHRAAHAERAIPFQPALVRSESPVRASHRPGRVLILGGDSDFNLGDKAILEALCGCLHSLQPGIQITVASRQADGPRPPGVVRVIPRRLRSVLEYISSARSQDLVLIGGGGLFQDDDSRVKMAYWSALIGALRLVNPNLAAHSVGAGPLNRWESRLCARFISSALRSITVRDRFAADWLSRCISKPVSIVPDPSFMLRPALPEAGAALIRSAGLDPSRPIIGVALRRWFHRLGGFMPHVLRHRIGWDRGFGDGSLDQMLQQIELALRQMASDLDAQILLMPTYNVSHEADSAVCARLQARIADLDSALVEITDPALYKSVAGHLRLMLAARMHPLILASSMNVPVVGLAYNGKFTGLFDSLGIPHRFMWLNECAGAGTHTRIADLAAQALQDPTDYGRRAGQLGATVFEQTAAMLRGAQTGIIQLA